MATDKPIQPLNFYLHHSQFPEGFKFGCASSAFQIEGAVDIDGRAPSIWDTFSEENNLVTGDHSWKDGVDHYHRYKEDVSIMNNISLNAYRFSISWSRILPDGTKAGGENPEGIKFYNDLIDELLEKGLEPFVTLFHWDLPQALEDKYGGFRDRQIIDDFRDFAEVCFEHFGDRVKNWMTLNEPWSFSYYGYALGSLAPGRGYEPAITYRTRSIEDILPPSQYPYRSAFSRFAAVGDPGTEPYTVTHNQLLAHAAAVKLFKKKYENNPDYKIGIALVTRWMVPYSDKPEDISAAQRALDFWFGWFMDPITTGDYPASMRKFVGDRLPTFERDESDSLIGSIDFLGLNYYTANYVEDAPDMPTDPPHYFTDQLVQFHTQRDGELIGDPASPSIPWDTAQLGDSQWLYNYPIGIHDLLTYIRDKYNNPIIHITENGLDESNNPDLSMWDALFDHRRMLYHQDHLAYVKKAIEGGSKVEGYFGWSILDNFEWTNAFSRRFGITFVDYENGLARYPKLSSGWFKYFLQ